MVNVLSCRFTKRASSRPLKTSLSECIASQYCIMVLLWATSQEKHFILSRRFYFLLWILAPTSDQPRIDKIVSARLIYYLICLQCRYPILLWSATPSKSVFFSGENNPWNSEISDVWIPFPYQMTRDFQLFPDFPVCISGGWEVFVCNVLLERIRDW